MQGDGKGGFTPVTLYRSGFFTGGDGKGLASVHSEKGEDLIIATQNQDSLRVFSPYKKRAEKSRWISLGQEDSYADILYKGNKIDHQEFYLGSGYLSQSSRKFKIEADMLSMYITDFRGRKRQLKF